MLKEEFKTNYEILSLSEIFQKLYEDLMFRNYGKKDLENEKKKSSSL